jgi:hypothetical protein
MCLRDNKNPLNKDKTNEPKKPFCSFRVHIFAACIILIPDKADIHGSKIASAIRTVSNYRKTGAMNRRRTCRRIVRMAIKHSFDWKEYSFVNCRRL